MNVLTGDAFEDETDEASEETSESTVAEVSSILYQAAVVAESRNLLAQGPFETESELPMETQVPDETEAPLETETIPESETVTESETITETESEIESEPETESAAESESEMESEPETEKTEGFKVSFINYDGSILLEERLYEAGQRVTKFPSTIPGREGAEDTRYIFVGWKSMTTGKVHGYLDLPKVTEDVVYMAVYYEFIFSIDNIFDADLLQELLAKLDTAELMKWLEKLGLTEYLEGYINELVQSQIQNMYGSIDWSSILGSMTFELTAEQIEALLALAMREGIELGGKLADCGTLVFDTEQQDVHAGGSGCGCRAVALCGYLLEQLQKKKLKRILFCGTGALLSPTSTQQGLSIPGVCHAVSISGE